MKLYPSPYIYRGLFSDRVYGQLWKKYCELLRRGYILLFWENVLSIPIKSIWFITSVSFTVSLFSLSFPHLSIDESMVLNSPTIIVWCLMCALSFSEVSFMNAGALVCPCIWSIYVLSSSC